MLSWKYFITTKMTLPTLPSLGGDGTHLRKYVDDGEMLCLDHLGVWTYDFSAQARLPLGDH